MTKVSKRLEQIVKKELSKNLIPVKVDQGILVGDILICSEQHLKSIYRKNQLLYKEVHLNCAAIKIANILALRQHDISTDMIYKADQEYGRWFVESQMLRSQHQKSVNNLDYDKADMLWARYVESRTKMIQAKSRAEYLSRT